MNILAEEKKAALFWWALILYFALFSFNALATSTMAALIGTRWELLTSQDKFMIFVAITANWTGLVLVFIQKGMSRILSGKAPIETGDTQHLAKS